MRIQVMGFSSIGKRKEQQDSFRYLLDRESAVAVICDGMGGLSGGALASHYGVNRFMLDYQNRDESQSLIRFLNEEIIVLDDAIFQMRNPEGNRLGAGSTIVAAVIQEGKLYWLSVGDSKLYVYRKGQLRCVTREHNYRLILDEMKADGNLSEKAYHIEEKRADGLISYLGMGNVKVYDVNKQPFDIKPGDRYLLCSDGIYKTIPDEILEECMKLGTADVKSTVQLFQQVIDENDKESQDNATLIILAVD